MILAIDPGNEESGIVLLNDDLSVIEAKKLKNEEIQARIYNEDFEEVTHIAIEMVASYGMAVGKTVFETCVWIGRFYESLFNKTGIEPRFIYRKEETLNLCNSPRGGDSNVIQALRDRFALGVSNYGKGTKKNPGWFYGFSKDIWQAYAVGVTYYDKYLITEKANKILNK